jgi:hypothetical protein
MTPRKYSIYLITNTLLVFVVALGAYSLYQRFEDRRTDVSVTETVQYACGPIDVSNDGGLDLVDFARFAQVYNSDCVTTTIPDEIPQCGFMDGDLSGKVNIVDFAMFASRYGKDNCVQAQVGKKVSMAQGQYSLDVEYKGNFIWTYQLTRPQSLECRSINIEVAGESRTNITALIGNDMLNDNECISSQTGKFIASGNSYFSFGFADESVGRGESIALNTTISGFTFELESIGDTEWEYTISGFVPNGCTDGTVEVDINGSAQPVEVTITLTLTELRDPGILCTQALEPISLTGIYQAPVNATHSFLVTEAIVNTL